MSEFRIDQITNQSGSRGPDIAGITTFTGTSGMLMPSGPTEYRGGRGRGLIFCGYNGSGFDNTIDYITISTLGNATNFGDTTFARETSDSGFSSSTRGFVVGGSNQPTSSPGRTNIIDYTTISSTGNTFDFGDLTTARYGTAGVSDSTRGIAMGGDVSSGSPVDTIDYITMSSLGNASDYGDLTFPLARGAGFQSSTRGVQASGGTPTALNSIQYITIATTGNAQDFGDATYDGQQLAGASNSVRGIFAGSANINIINYVTIASTGDAIDFGDLITARREDGALSSSIRWVIAGGYNDSGGLRLNSIEYVTIMTTGNAQDFGDLTVGRSGTSCCSDAHGGLGD